MARLTPAEREERASLREREKLASLREREEAREQARRSDDWNATLREKAATALLRPRPLAPGSAELKDWQVTRVKLDLAGLAYFRRQDLDRRPVLGADLNEDGSIKRILTRCQNHATKHTPGTVESVACRLNYSGRTLQTLSRNLGLERWPRPEDDFPAF